MNNDPNADECKRFAGEREAFEAWATSVGYHTERDMFQRDKYQSTVTWELWRVWQARASLPAPQQATPEPVGEQISRAEAIRLINALIDGDTLPPVSLELLRELTRPAPGVPEGWTDADADAARLAMELECLLLDTKDTAAVSRWWKSANEALDLHRARLAAAQAKGVV